jgi:hypothetical protein
MKILKQFSQSKEHADAQCSIICLMSHGEEGSLTVQDGEKVSMMTFTILSDNSIIIIIIIDLS